MGNVIYAAAFLRALGLVFMAAQHKSNNDYWAKTFAFGSFIRKSWQQQNAAMLLEIGLETANLRLSL